jgi:hypothetical protein
MPYIDQGVSHAGSAEVLFTGMFDELTGTLARTIPRWGIGSGGLTTFNTTGQVAVRVIPLPQGLLVSNIAVMIGNTGATTPTHYWAGLCDPLLNVLAVSADQLTAAQTANAPLKVAMGIPYLVPQTGLYYVACSSSASTAPTGGGNTLITGPAPGPPILCGTAGTQATPPAVGSQLNSGTITAANASNIAIWIS